jgi:lysine 2,3-aminomutase
MLQRAARTLKTVDDLRSAGLIGDAAALRDVAARYDIAVTPTMAALIEAPDDPIARQFVPHADEAITRADEHPDPTGDAAHSPVKGIVHRYPDRALLTPLHACPVYCRYCFRRERVGAGGGVLSETELEAALDYIRATPGLREVILTGGDPLMLSPRRLGAIIAALSAVPQLETLRIHSRVPVAAPEMVTPALVAACDTPKAVWLVIHANHPRELTDACRATVVRFTRAGIPVLSQSVLLAGVNDDAAVLESLFRALVAMRVKPYYLHHLDPAPGTARFRVPLARGRAIVRALRGRLSGLAQPTYVLDIPGGAGKVPVAASHAEFDGDGWRLTDRAGASHRLAGDGESG